MNQTYNLAGGDVCLFHADCRDALRALPDNCIDSVCTDPPYALTSVVKRFGSPTSAPAQYGKDGAFARQSAGFMGCRWDSGEVAFDPAFWSEVLRVLKPGGHVAAMGGTRTYHHLAMAIELAGFEIRNSLMWVYGTGFNKNGYIRDSAGEIVKEGWAGALKPAFEPIVLARKPLSEKTVALNMARWGTGALNIDACRVHGADVAEPRNRHGGGVVGAGTSYEFPDSKGEIPPGRWPANIILSGEDCIVDAFPSTKSGLLQAHHVRHQDKKVNVYGDWADGDGSNFQGAPSYGDEGSASRFFTCCPYEDADYQEFHYSGKANKADRAGSVHPTIKPIRLLKWCTNLLTPNGRAGVVLDPFAGSGTTGQAALQNGFKAILCEREAEYVADIIRRLSSPSLVPPQSPP